LLERGWEQIPASAEGKKDTSFRLKWCERASDYDFNSLREKKQLIGRNPKISIIGNKLKLNKTMREFHQKGRRPKAGKGAVAAPGNQKRLTFRSYMPQTFEVEDRKDREAFAKEIQEDPTSQWICKPTGRNQGHGIFVVPDGAQFIKDLEEEKKTRSPMRAVSARIVQRYITNPLLLGGRKFDIRAYLLLATAHPLTAFYGGDFYVRRSIAEYADADSGDLSAHLTNQAVQKKHPKYKEMFEDTTWGMDQLNDYINEMVAAGNSKVEENWTTEVLPAKIKLIMRHVLSAIKGKIDDRMGVFDFLGLDFLVDEDFNVWLLEVNVNPALHTNSEVLERVITPKVARTMDIVLEVFDKQVTGKSIMPIKADLGDFEHLELI